MHADQSYLDYETLATLAEIMRRQHRTTRALSWRMTARGSVLVSWSSRPPSQSGGDHRPVSADGVRRPGRGCRRDGDSHHRSTQCALIRAGSTCYRRTTWSAACASSRCSISFACCQSRRTRWRWRSPRSQLDISRDRRLSRTPSTPMLLHQALAHHRQRDDGAGNAFEAACIVHKFL
jgi:hypothetical protein